jgi:hypothetical protein
MTEAPNNFITLLGASVWLAYILLVWFRTNAFAEYVNLFKLSKFFKVGKYYELVENGYPEGYIQFLKEYYHDSFLIRLFTCPICFGFWLGLGIALGLNVNFLVIPIGLFLYGCLNRII